MRRLLIILLLTILPFQAALAAACAYCPDSCAPQSAAASEVVTLDAAEVADDCSRCQLGGAGIVPSSTVSHSAPSVYKLGLPDSGSFPASGKPDRPERPNWDRAA